VYCLTVPIGLALILHYDSDSLSTMVRRVFWWSDQASAAPLAWLPYFAPYIRLLEFVCGMLACQAYRSLSHGVPPPRIMHIILALAVVWCLAVLAFPGVTTNALVAAVQPNFIYAPALALLLLYCCLYDTWLSRALSSVPLLAMGTISYSVYVWSFFVLTWLHPNFASPAPSALAYLNSTVGAAICMGLTTVLAYGCYHLVEAPSRRWIRRLARNTSRLATDKDVPAQPRAG
jgi:peptidoglycan/LPS O-acetylase OafA/YrhL